MPLFTPHNNIIINGVQRYIITCICGCTHDGAISDHRCSGNLHDVDGAYRAPFDEWKKNHEMAETSVCLVNVRYRHQLIHIPISMSHINATQSSEMASGRNDSLHILVMISDKSCPIRTTAEHVCAVRVSDTCILIDDRKHQIDWSIGRLDQLTRAINREARNGGGAV